LGNRCGEPRFSIEKNAVSTLSTILGLDTQVTKIINDEGIRLTLYDEKPNAIYIARIPINSMNNFEPTVALLQKAAIWSTIIKDLFKESEDIQSTKKITLQPQPNFSIQLTYWIPLLPDSLSIFIIDIGNLTTNYEGLNQIINPETTLSDIIYTVMH
jgi:hypothetical protein